MFTEHRILLVLPCTGALTLCILMDVPIHLVTINTVKPVLSGHSNIGKNKGLKDR